MPQKKLGKAVNEYNKAKNEIQEQMKIEEEQTPKITGPVGTEREKLETMAKSMGVNVEKTDDELRKMISEKIGQKKKDEPKKQLRDYFDFLILYMFLSSRFLANL